MRKNDGRPDQQQGFHEKYHVERLNDPAGKHRNCHYYVLDLIHDKHAPVALEAYAASCEAEYPELAKDLRLEAIALRESLGMSPLPEERTPICFVIAVEEYGHMVVYGPQYTVRRSAEQDAELPRKRGQRAEVWECFAVSPQKTPAMWRCGWVPESNRCLRGGCGKIGPCEGVPKASV